MMRHLQRICSAKFGFLYQEYRKDIPAYAKQRNMTVEEAGREYRLSVYRKSLGHATEIR